MNPCIEGGEVSPLVQSYNAANDALACHTTDYTVGPAILQLSHDLPRRTLSRLSRLTCNSSARPSSMSSNLLLSTAARPSEYLTFLSAKKKGEYRQRAKFSAKSGVRGIALTILDDHNTITFLIGTWIL